MLYKNTIERSTLELLKELQAVKKSTIEAHVKKMTEKIF